MQKHKWQIGIGITARVNDECFLQTLEQITKLAPNGAKIVVVDNGCEEKIEEASFRFDSYNGSYQAKNKCIELLAECEHIFLFDDSTYPKTKEWFKPYIELPEPRFRFCYSFERDREYFDLTISNDNRQIARKRNQGEIENYIFHHPV